MPLVVEVPTRREGDEVVFDYELTPIAGGEFLMPDRFTLIYTPSGDEPAWRMEFAVRQGAPQCRRFVIEASGQGREIRTADLRGLRIEDLVELASTNVAARRVVEGGEERVVRDIGDLRSGASLRATRTARRATRRKITDETLAEVAEIYRANADDSPTEAVRLHLGVAERTARLYVRRARDAGFLGESYRGKAGER